jgi:hypothetical protein
MTALIESRAARKGDRVQSMTIIGRNGVMWAGEFHTVLGAGDLSGFLAASDRKQIGTIYLTLEDGTLTTANVLTAFRVDMH